MIEMHIDTVKANLIEAEKKAAYLFSEVEKRGLIVSGKSEEELNEDIFNLAFELFGIYKFWHKRIVRAGRNTLEPYKENPKNLVIQQDDIVFLDFGPIFDVWEADFGRTYVIGTDKLKLKLKRDIELAWEACRTYFMTQTEITGAELYQYAVSLAHQYGWEFGGEIAGHIIGHFPHEKLSKEDKRNYIHPSNHENMFAPDKNGKQREWILEIHFVNRELGIGGFFEQLLV